MNKYWFKRQSSSSLDESCTRLERVMKPVKDTTSRIQRFTITNPYYDHGKNILYRYLKMSIRCIKKDEANYILSESVEHMQFLLIIMSEIL